MRDAGIGPPGDFHALQIPAELLRGRQLDRPMPRRTRADEGAVNIPKQETLWCVRHSERSFANAKRSRGISRFMQIRGQ